MSEPSPLAALMRDLSLSPEKQRTPATSASPQVEQLATRRYSVIDVHMTYSIPKGSATPSQAGTIAPSPVTARTLDFTTSDEKDSSPSKPKSTTDVEKVEEPPVAPVPPVVTAAAVATPPPRPALPADVQRFVKRLEDAKNVIVMVGAGLSVAAGIPDFRTPGRFHWKIMTTIFKDTNINDLKVRDYTAN